MTYAQFIALLRAEAKDSVHPMHNDFTGDGATTLFVVTDLPIIESSYVVKVGVTQKTEGSDYTLDKESGLITFAVAPTNATAVTIDYKYAHLTDASWLQIINEVIADMEGEFWKEVDDVAWDTSEDGVLSYVAPTKCIDVINAFYKTSSGVDEWMMLSEFCNWRYSKDLNTVNLGKPFYDNTHPLRLNYLKGYTLGSVTSATIDLQSLYEGVLKLGCMSKYYNYRLADRVETITKVSKERTVTPLQNLQALSAHYYKLYLKEKGRRKPTKPMRILVNNKPNGGTP